jgi:hypothetical protein
MTEAAFGFLLSDASAGERLGRLRELRALAHVHLGARHPCTLAFAEAVADPAAGERALFELERVAALPRRRLLCTFGALTVPASIRRQRASAALPRFSSE